MFKLVVPWNKTPSFGIARHIHQDEVLTPHYYELIMEAVRFNPCISLPLDILNYRFLGSRTIIMLETLENIIPISLGINFIK